MIIAVMNVHNCVDYSLLVSKSAGQYMKHFTYHFTITKPRQKGTNERKIYYGFLNHGKFKLMIISCVHAGEKSLFLKLKPSLVLLNSLSCFIFRSRTRSRSPASTTSTSPKRKSTPSATTSFPEGSNRRTASQQSRTPSPGRRAPSKRSKGTTPSRKTPTSPRKSPKKVTPIKLVRFQDDRYSVVKSVVKRHSDQSDNDTSTNYGKSKRKRFDRYSIVETTPMKIRLRRSRRKSSPSARASKLIGRSP